MDDWFDELHEDRASWVASTRRNKFERGVRQFAVEKYADPTHFVYELLQNAEDQEATSASFHLTPDRLIFEHNGTGFTREDVENITGLGNTAKPEQANKIGRFGIGFKSVFVITDRPAIYTTLDGEPFAFCIEDLVVPVRASCPEGYLPPGRTRFVLPLKAQGGAEARETVEDRLRKLGADSLLFLRHLTEITWRTPSHEGACRCKRDETHGRVVLLGETGPKGGPEHSGQTEYVVFSKEIQIEDADRQLGLSIAFRMHEGRIVPEPGQAVLDVYFPTEERTGLRFRLHGPFLLTDNRGNLKRGEEANDRLILASADLLAESLPVLRDQGLLTVDALSCLPLRYETKKPSVSLPDDDEGQKGRDYEIAEARGFEPLFRAVRDTLMNEPLLPTDDGGHVAGKDAKLARSAAVRELLGGAELTELFGATSRLQWLSPEITDDRTPGLRDYLRDVIGVGEVDPDAFAARLTADFLAKRDDDWIGRLYEFLIEQEALWEKGRPRATLRRDPKHPIIRLEDGTHVAPFRLDGETRNAYLPPHGDTQHPIVRRSICQGRAKVFLEKLGLTKPDVVADVLDVTLPRYAARGVEIDWEEYGRDIEQIGRAIAACTQAQMGNLQTRLKGTPFVAAYNAANPDLLSFNKPDEVYDPIPSVETWFEGNDEAWFIHPQLREMGGWESICSHLTIMAQVGFRARPAGSDGHTRLESYYGRHLRGLRGFDPDACIEGLQHAIRAITIEKAKILWGILAADVQLVQGTVEEATRQTFDNVHRRTVVRSSAGKICATSQWVPDAAGQFHEPADLFLGEVHPSLETGTGPARLLAEALGMRRPEEQEAARALGVPDDMRDDLIRVLRDHPDSLRQFVASMVKPAFPARSPADPARRSEKVRLETDEAGGKTYEIRPRSVRTSKSEVSEGTREYLRDLYTNGEAQLICQVCQEEMPFRLDGGWGPHYFEAVECIRTASKECIENYLALCPTCAAMFLHANDTSPEDLKGAILNAAGLVAPISLAGGERALRFVETHLRDLQAVLEAEDGIDIPTVDLPDTTCPGIT